MTKQEEELVVSIRLLMHLSGKQDKDEECGRCWEMCKLQFTY